MNNSRSERNQMYTKPRKCSYELGRRPKEKEVNEKKERKEVFMAHETKEKDFLINVIFDA